MKSGTTLRLILGDQLNTQHSWFRQVRADTLYTLMEVRKETRYIVLMGIQKVAGFFSAMRHFADALARAGHRVVYLRLDDPINEQSFDANLIRLIREQRIARLEYMQPDDYRLDGQLARLAAHLSIPSTVVETEHFLTTRSDLTRHFQGKKRYLMESFYRQIAGAMMFSWTTASLRAANGITTKAIASVTTERSRYRDLRLQQRCIRYRRDDR